MSPRAARSLALASALLAGACGGAPSQPERAPAARSFAIGGLRIAAEGPCSHLAVHAIGDRRVLVFGDTGYDLAGWLPGDEIPAAQSIAVLTPDGAGRDPALLRGLPTDARGYVPGHLVVGGHAAHDAWLLRVTTRYAPGGGGALFARASEGYRLGERGWRVTAGSPVDRPPSTRGLPELPTGACGEGHTWIPLASATTRGGVLVAGRCDDPRVPNPSEASILVAHGRPGATAWEVARIPGTSNLDGIVNVDLAARADDDAVLVAWEPFVPLERRQPYAARWDGRRWAVLAIDRPGGYLGVAQRPVDDDADRVAPAALRPRGCPRRSLRARCPRARRRAVDRGELPGVAGARAPCGVGERGVHGRRGAAHRVLRRARARRSRDRGGRVTSRPPRSRAVPRTLLGALLGAALVGAPGDAAAQSSLGFFPERHLVCREPRRVDAPSSPRPAPAVGLLPLPRRAAPAALPMAPLVVIDVAVAEPVPDLSLIHI